MSPEQAPEPASENTLDSTVARAADGAAPPVGIGRVFPPRQWLAEYQARWLPADVFAGITLAAYAVPVSLAYASLAGLPPQAGLYGYLLGGLGYALLGSSRHLAVGPTSAISLMMAGTLAGMAGGDGARYAEIASLVGFMVALLCLIAWLLRLSILVRLISDSVLVGFKAGAGLSIAITQLPDLFGIPGGGQNFAERVLKIASQLGETNSVVLALGIGAIVLLVLGERLLPGRPVALGVVVLSIIAVSLFGLAAHGVAVTGDIPVGLPRLRWPELRIRDIEGVVPLATGCLLLAYIEGVSAARGFAARHEYALDPRQELLGLGAANFAAALGGGYPVAGGLSQSAVIDKAGVKTPAALVFASITLAFCLLFLTGLLQDLPKAALAAVVLTAVRGLIDLPALLHMWRVSRIDFFSAIAALAGVLLLGILQGILLAVLVSILLLLAVTSRPHVAFLGRIPGTRLYSDMERHPENEPLPGIIAFRPEGPLIYISTESVMNAVLERLDAAPPGSVRLVVCDMSGSPNIDLAGSRMLLDLLNHVDDRGIKLRITGAHARVRDLLRNEGLADRVGGLHRSTPLEAVLQDAEAGT